MATCKWRLANGDLQIGDRVWSIFRTLYELPQKNAKDTKECKVLCLLRFFAAMSSSMPEQKLFRVDQRPLDILPRFTLIGRLGDVSQGDLHLCFRGWS